MLFGGLIRKEGSSERLFKMGGGTYLRGGGGLIRKGSLS